MLLLLGIVSVAAFAGSAVIGSVAGSTNATIGGQALMPNTTIFSGDSLKVNDGAAVVAVGNTSRVVFGRETVASFLRDTNEVTVLLSQGNVSFMHPDDSVALRVKVGDISVSPAKGFKTLGEVAMVNDSVVVTAKDGMLRVDRNGSSVDVAKGKTITVSTKVARAPKPAAGSMGGASAINVAAAALAGVGAVEGALAISRANDAKTNAASADTNAKAATAAATAAGATAATANTNAIAAGCALNQVAGASPFTPTGGTAPGC